MAKRASLLGPFEYEVLRGLTIYPEADYGQALAEQLCRSVGSVQTALHRLEAKGMARSSWSDPIGARGGRRRRLFVVNVAGHMALRQTQDHFVSG